MKSLFERFCLTTVADAVKDISPMRPFLQWQEVKAIILSARQVPAANFQASSGRQHKKNAVS